MRKELFKAIAEALRSVQGVEYVDLWNEQIADLAGGIAFKRPAVFIEFDIIDWRQLNNNGRRGTVSVRLHIITQATKANGSTDKAMSRVLELFDFINSINAAMQGLRGQNFAGFMHTASLTNHFHAELIDSVECFSTSVQDISAMRPVVAISGLSPGVSTSK